MWSDVALRAAPSKGGVSKEGVGKAGPPRPTIDAWAVAPSPVLAFCGWALPVGAKAPRKDRKLAS